MTQSDLDPLDELCLDLRHAGTAANACEVLCKCLRHIRDRLQKLEKKEPHVPK